VSIPSISLFVFDLDGTLIDSRQDLADAANETLAAYGQAPLPTQTVARMVGEGARVLLDRVFAARGQPTPDTALERFLAAYDDRLVVHTRPYAGACELVAALAARAKVAVLTNKPQRPSERLVSHFGLAPHVFRVIGGDAEIARKPDPAGVRLLMDAASSDPARTLLVGDSWVDHEAALRAGVRVALARYGFGFDQIPRHRLRGDEILLDRPSDLLDWLFGRAPERRE
jgi:phosphoglycolate phosphatase